MIGELELNDEQSKRNDEIYDEVYDLCRVMSEKPDLEWNMSFIGEIADFAAFILDKHGIKVRFPSIVTNPDGSQYVEEYFSRV